MMRAMRNEIEQLLDSMDKMQSEITERRELG